MFLQGPERFPGKHASGWVQGRPEHNSCSEGVVSRPLFRAKGAILASGFSLAAVGQVTQHLVIVDDLQLSSQRSWLSSQPGKFSWSCKDVVVCLRPFPHQ